MKLQANKYLKPLKFLMEKSGANFHQVAKLVDLKLLLDNRKVLPNNKGKSKDPKNSIIRQSFAYIFIGVFLIISTYKINDPFFFIIISHLMLLVMNTMTMLAEYSVSLFDTRDNNLILPLPVNGQTVGWARVTHILLYLLLLSFSMIIPGIIYVCIKFSVVTGFLFLISVFLSTLFTLFFTVFIYLALIKVTSGEKVKDVMMYLQVFLTVGIMIIYQILPRYLNSNAGETFSITKQWFFILIPPAWFASFSTIAIQFDSLNLTCAIIAIAVPILGISKIGKKLFYGFNDSLLKIDIVSGGKSKAKIQQSNNKTTIWMQFTALLMGVKKSEAPIYKLIWNMSGRERLFKQSLLPILSYAAIMPILISYTSGDFADIKTKYLPFLYFTIMSSSMLVSIISIGNNKNADWIFKSLPNIQPYDIFKGSIKAAFAKFFIPVFLLVSLPLFYFNGIAAIIDIACIFTFNLMLTMFTLYYQIPYFAFTQEKAASQGGKTAIKIFLIILLALPLGFLHSFLQKNNIYLVLVPTAIYGILLSFMNKHWIKKRFNWSYINLVKNQF